MSDKLLKIEHLYQYFPAGGFGKNKKRSWYSARPFTWKDILCIVVCLAIFAASIIITIVNGSRYFNPFI